MSWELSPKVSLHNERVPTSDADRQMQTAAEVLRRLDDQPGLVLADEVGMGKTYVALAVAVSVVEATRRKRPVVVMVPPSVAEKWPKEWAVFSERCLTAGHGLRACGPIRRGSDFLKLLDDPASRRNHVIFMTHGALTMWLIDPFVHLALLRQGTANRRDGAHRRRAIASFARSLLNDSRFADQELVSSLLATPPARWMTIWNHHRPDHPLDDDPVPFALLEAMRHVDLTELRRAIDGIPLRHSASLAARLKDARSWLRSSMNEVYSEGLRYVDAHLPLLILDEAHHVRHQTQLAGLFANAEAEQDAEALRGALGNMFDRMLFLTATPFQLGHGELLNVLRRFHGVRWGTKAARAGFDEQLDDLLAALDRAQATSLRFERAWSRLGPDEEAAAASLNSFDVDDKQPDDVRAAIGAGREAYDALEHAERLLQPWVIRHLKSDKRERRHYRPGRDITDDRDGDCGGLLVDGSATLPFLLAARAQAVASLEGAAGERSTRAYFAYGLASSFEAYADTRRNRLAQLDDNDETQTAAEVSPQLRWYLDRIAASLPRDTADGWAGHPKMAAVVDRVMQLWRDGEKALVFCFYVETGRALRAHISRALQDEIVKRGRAALQISDDDPDRVLDELERTSERLLRVEARGYDAFRKKVIGLASGLDDETAEAVAEIVIRFMRTPSFLVRFVDLSPHTNVSALTAAFDRADGSGLTLGQRIQAFAEYVSRLVTEEKDELLAALLGVQTGAIGTYAEDLFDESERSRARETLLPNVRLANGGVRAETRRRLMLTFNTPFFPEVLVASSVMAEGVDLHLDCRHVIHHDLDWNPSTLEQRTGRVDRIGSKGERSGQPIVVYEPYLGGTHDEKQYRVVKDRERWFGVVMGEKADLSERATERRAQRIPLPDALCDLLTLDLSVAGRRVRSHGD